MQHAEIYRVLKTSADIPLVNNRFAKPGTKFRATDVLCYPQQLESLLALEGDAKRIEAVVPKTESAPKTAALKKRVKNG